MDPQIRKLQAHARHSLDGMIYLRERYAILEPMLADKSVRQDFGSGKRTRGFEVLRYSLLLACIQDLVKITVDTDPRAPSVHNILAAISDKRVASKLRVGFAEWNHPIPAEYADDREILSALTRMDEREESERRQQFDMLYADLQSKWADFRAKPTLQSFRTVRDKVSAHTEIRPVAYKYQPIQIGELGITLTDLRTAVDDLQEIVELMGLIVRNADFAWDILSEQLSQASRDFWTIP
jgi:hypothetical protein